MEIEEAIKQGILHIINENEKEKFPIGEVNDYLISNGCEDRQDGCQSVSAIVISLIRSDMYNNKVGWGVFRDEKKVFEYSHLGGLEIGVHPRYFMGYNTIIYCSRMVIITGLMGAGILLRLRYIYRKLGFTFWINRSCTTYFLLVFASCVRGKG